MRRTKDAGISQCLQTHFMTNVICISTRMLLTMLEEKGKRRMKMFQKFLGFFKDMIYLIIAYWKKYSYRRNEEVIESLLLKSEMFFQSVSRHVQFNSRIVS